MKLHYVTIGDAEHAHIETAEGYYVCTVEQTCGEGERAFRRRARSLLDALEYSPPSVLLGEAHDRG